MLRLEAAGLYSSIDSSFPYGCPFLSYSEALSWLIRFLHLNPQGRLSTSLSHFRPCQPVLLPIVHSRRRLSLQTTSILQDLSTPRPV